MPGALVDVPDGPGEVLTDILSMQPLWPGAVALPPGHDTAYEGGLMASACRTSHHDTGRACADPGAAAALSRTDGVLNRPVPPPVVDGGRSGGGVVFNERFLSDWLKYVRR